MKELIVIHTDGACFPNPGHGTWGALIEVGDERHTISGYGGSKTTNNRMELQAIMEAVYFALDLKLDLPIVVYSDSKYAANLAASKWKAKVNQDIIDPLQETIRHNDIEVKWVPREENEDADSIAGEAYKEYVGMEIPSFQEAKKGFVKKKYKRRGWKKK